MTLLQRALAGSVMILAAALLRALLLHRLPKNAFVLLWLLAAARLLLPLSLPAPFDTPVLPAQAVGAFAPPVWSVRAVPAAAAPVRAAASDFPVWKLLWALGSAVCGAYFLAVYVRCRREFRASLPMDCAPAQAWLDARPLRRTVSLRRSDRVGAPLTYGVLRPVILLPKGMAWAAPGTMEYVLAHELVHIRRFDGCKKLLLAAALCLHWWNPLVWVLYVLAGRDIELACDEAVVRSAGRPADYARALLAMEAARDGAALFSHFSQSAMEERIFAIMKLKRKTIFSILLAAVLVAGAATAFATSAKTPQGDAPVYAPNFMQPFTKILYDDALQYTVLEGGALTEAEIAGREDIAEIGMVTESEDQRVKPGCLVEYDAHGFLQNIYFSAPNQPGEYQLQDPDTAPDTAAFDLLDAYRVAGYEQMSVADFNALLVPERDDLDALLAAYAEVPTDVTAADDFLAVTLKASLGELFAEALRQPVTFLGTAARQERPAGTMDDGAVWYDLWLSVSYALDYDIPDPAAITVAERDAAFRGFQAAYQQAIDALPEEALFSKQTLAACGAALAAEYSGERLTLTFDLGFCDGMQGGSRPWSTDIDS